ncbi:MAG: hypothetical protein GX591_19085 [Planctomycetes bacterium]|nr:hypothetical protein [Planctomycetota bacterium]
MTIIAGIDEAGFGPLLGPLVVSAVVFEAPGDGEVDFWRQLAPAVAKAPGKRCAGVAIGDSKRIYSPATGLVHLERGGLGFLSLLEQPCQSLRALLAWLSPEVLGAMEEYPWYRQADLALPLEADATDLRLRANGVRAAMAAAGMKLLGAQVRLLPEGHFNRLVAATDNKATTLCDQTFSLIDWVWRNRPRGASVRIVVDRQGGRQHYLPILQRMYPHGGTFRILAEQGDHSGYVMAGEDGTLDLHFLAKGESLHLPIALASMVSKYLRELFMALFNRFWAARVGAHLVPTAGYYTDGRRFLADIAEAVRTLGVDEALLVRSR